MEALDLLFWLSIGKSFFLSKSFKFNSFCCCTCSFFMKMRAMWRGQSSVFYGRLLSRAAFSTEASSSSKSESTETKEFKPLVIPGLTVTETKRVQFYQAKVNEFAIVIIFFVLIWIIIFLFWFIVFWTSWAKDWGGWLDKRVAMRKLLQRLNVPCANSTGPQ